jgi:hypothetical protein
MLVLPALALASSFLVHAYPTTADAAPGEDAKLGPMEVCAEMADAAKKSDFDRIVAHSTAYARQRFSEKDRVALKAAHAVLISVRCVRIDRQDDAQALVWVYAPDGHSQDLPFIKESGFWRFDEQRWEQMRKDRKKKSCRAAERRSSPRA